MVRTILILASILCAALIAFALLAGADGALDVSKLFFLLWNCSPLFLVVLIALLWRRVQKGSNPRDVANRACLLTYCFVCLALTTCLYSDFLYDLKTGNHISSTYGLVFVFCPIEIAFAGFIAAALAHPIAFLIRRHNLGTNSTRPTPD